MSSLVNVGDDGVDIVSVSELPRASKVSDKDWIVVNVSQGAGELTTKAQLSQVFEGTVDDAKASAIAAAASAEDAKKYVDGAVGMSKPYETVAKAQAAITAGVLKEGDVFTVVSDKPGGAFDVYVAKGGVPVPVLDSNGVQVSVASAEALAEVTRLVTESLTSPLILEVLDQKDYVAMSLDKEYTLRLGGDTVVLKDGSLSAGAMTVEVDDTAPYAVNLKDADGYILDLTTPRAEEVGPVTPTEADWKQVTARNAENLGKAANVFRKKNTITQAITAQYNGVIMLGQSLSTGYEGWPALTGVESRLGNLMLGDATRPARRGSNAFEPLNNGNLNPLKAVVQTPDGTRLLTDSEVAALAPGASNEGESPIVAAVNYMKHLWLDHVGKEIDDDMVFIASDCGVAGRSIEQLRNNHWNMFTQAVDKQKAAADAAGKTFNIPVVFFMQGEWNYAANGGTSDKDAYKALLKAYRKDAVDYIISVTGQLKPPAFIMYQTGANYTGADDQLTIGRAQWEVAQEVPGCYIATTIYEQTDKGGHLQPNGYRSTGINLGWAAFQIAVLRGNFEPTHMLSAVAKDNEALVNILAPTYPIVFRDAYVGVTPTMYPTRGFLFKDGVGVLPVTSIEVLKDSVVHAVFGRKISGDLTVTYASKTSNSGNGNVADSSSNLSMYDYVYTEGTGQYPTTNIPALVNKPYSTASWCIADKITAEVIQ
ncbi:hypothetical protein KASHIRA_00480 [Serratia phage vB_SmaM-Kashira]|nr:hypothetical protein KASHIRA_00480 [Serratia phage vB_SmaM-Kashira]